jgi:iron complex outermembrane recepter protein
MSVLSTGLVERSRRALFCGASVFALAATCLPAFAADQASTIETVTVTAERRAEDPQKTGVSLTALSDAQLKALAPHTLQDLNGAAPNVFIGMGTAGPAQSAIFIRGQGYADVEKTQSPPVGVIQDGVFFANNTGQLLDMFDVCSVEVDQGPQGIFYGKNTSAGLINITRCAPTRQYGAQVSAGYGSFNDGYVRGVFNAPLGENGGVKVAGQWHTNDGYYQNVFTGKHAGGSRYSAINAVVDYDLTSWLNARFSFDHMHDNGGGSPAQFGNVLAANIFGISGLPSGFPSPYTGNPLNYNPVTGSPDGLGPWQIENRAGGDSDRYDNNIYSLTLKADTGIGEVVSQTAFMDEADLVYQDFDATCNLAPGCSTWGNPSALFLETIRDQKYQQFTQEFRLAGTAWGQLDYLAGFFYYHHNMSLHQNTDVAVDQYSSESDGSWSMFGNLDWHITDAIKLSGGLRYIDESKHFNTAYTLTLAGPTVIPIVLPIAQSKSWSHLVTRFNAQWQVTDGTLLYASRSEGFRSGGFSMRGTLSEADPSQSNYHAGSNYLSYNPETNVSYEIGAKNSFFDNSLTFNLDGFINDIDGFQQTSVVVTPGYGPGTNTYIFNMPKVEIKGLEFQLTAKVGEWISELDGLTLSGALGIQGAKITNGVVNGAEVAKPVMAGPYGSTFDFTGSMLQRAPSNNFTVRGTYTRDFGNDMSLTTTLGYSWISKFSLGFLLGAPDIQPGYGLLDASAQLNYQNYYLRVSGKNLTNEAYRDQSLPVIFFQGWGPPQTFGVEVGAKF